MALFTAVDPESLIDRAHFEPEYGRGAWSREGIEFGYRISRGTPTIGTVAERSLAHWAVAAGSSAVQSRLVDLGVMAVVGDGEKGVWGPRSEAALRTFQSRNADPASGRALVADGYLGQSDSRALWTPLLDAAEKKYGIPDRLLRGETAHESAMDCCAVGYYVYYPNTIGGLDYRGVDRGISQINSLANPQVTWEQAFDPGFSIEWSALRLRTFFDKYKASSDGRGRVDSLLWDAAVCAHNSPLNALAWVRTGGPTNDTAAKYVSSVKAARY